MKVGDLLNPEPPKDQPSPNPSPPTFPLFYSSEPSAIATSPSKSARQRLPKDAPVFRKGPTKGEVQFPPYEAGDDEELAQEYENYRIFPGGEIAEHCHHIPYSSDKKTFLTKTGRDAFEVFQYTFKLPGEEREYVVMWDYNIGLVRITPFFKSCKYSKTTPAKVLNANPGLRDISHSITGGYWMPFACAKAVATTFCYNVRFALVPIFGKDFPQICREPAHPAFGNFKIDASVIASCAAETRTWLNRNDTRFTPSSSREPSTAPNTPDLGSLRDIWRNLNPLPAEIAGSPRSRSVTDGGWDGSPPQKSPKLGWAAVNHPLPPLRLDPPPTSMPVQSAETHAAESLLMLASPKTKSEGFGRDIPRSVAPNIDTGKRARAVLEDSEAEASCSGSSSDDHDLAEPTEAGGKASEPKADSGAAYTLLQLRQRQTGYRVARHREKRLRCGSVPGDLP